LFLRSRQRGTSIVAGFVCLSARPAFSHFNPNHKKTLPSAQPRDLLQL
jgi:hypothetical protein